MVIILIPVNKSRPRKTSMISRSPGSGHVISQLKESIDFFIPQPYIAEFSIMAMVSKTTVVLTTAMEKGSVWESIGHEISRKNLEDHMTSM